MHFFKVEDKINTRSMNWGQIMQIFEKKNILINRTGVSHDGVGFFPKSCDASFIINF